MTTEGKKEALIELRDITKIYRLGNVEVKAVDGINLDICANEYIAIIGPSGSGKSTLMNIIGCLDSPTMGKYYLNKVEVSRLSDDRLAEIRNNTIGFIFQGFNLLPKLTALENVELPLIYKGMGKKERHAKSMEALEKVGLKERMHHRPSELSGGQQQRVAIARALVTNPSLILADEPTGNLDSKSGLEIINLLQQLHEQGNTIILITHDSNIAGMARRLVSIYDGQIVEDSRQSTVGS